MAEIEHTVENDVPVWCSEHMEPYCPRHGQAAENDAPEQPPIGGFCDSCGHFAGRHDEQGCHFDRPDPKADCDCKAMRWLGHDWPRPWLPAPEGMTTPCGYGTATCRKFGGCDANCGRDVAEGERMGGRDDVELVVPLSPKPPTTKYELTVRIRANSHEEIESELLTLTRGGYLLDSDYHKRDEFDCTDGRVTARLVHMNPGQTPENYRAELDAWWHSRKAGQ